MMIYKSTILAIVIMLLGCGGDKSDRELLSMGKVRELELNKLDAFIKSLHSFKTKPNTYFIFIDTLRSDKLSPKDTPHLEELRKQSLAFDVGYSSSTVTHSSTYGIFFANPVIYRDLLLKKEWGRGSPFIQALQRGGYRIHLNGSPWQFCIDTDHVFNKPKELRDAAESNLQLLYGLRTKDVVDFCYPNPGEPSVQQKVPQVKFTGKDEIGNTIQHQGYRDHAVISDLLGQIDNKSSSGNFHIVYLSGAHDPYAWLEYGHPLPGSNALESIEKYYKIDKPFFPWNANWDAYRPNNPTPEFRTQIQNSYMNAVRGIDFQIGRLVNKLKAKGVYDDSLIVVVSDHGEFLHEKGLFPSNNDDRLGHCCGTYAQNTHVPMLIKFPHSEFAGTRKIGSHLDIFPTMFDYLGYSNQKEVANIAVGKSLFSSSRSCAMSFDPRGTVAPSDFYVANAVDRNMLHLSLDWQIPFSFKGVLPRYLLNNQGNLVEYYGNFPSDRAFQLIKNGEYTQCVEELVEEPFNGDGNYCPSIHHLKINDLRRGFAVYDILDRLNSPFESAPVEKQFANVEKSGAKVLEDFDEIPLIKTNLDGLINKDFQFDDLFFNDAISKQSNYDLLKQTDYSDKFKRMERVNGFVFFGTGFSPEKIRLQNGVCQLSGGFDMNQYYHEGEAGQFVSTSRSPLIAKRFASVNFGDKSPRNGWVYVALIFGGIKDPEYGDKSQHKDIKIIHSSDKNKNLNDNYTLPILMSMWGEQEVSVTRGINWNNIVAYRAVNDKGYFEGPLFVRSALKGLDLSAYKNIINKLSGE